LRLSLYLFLIGSGLRNRGRFSFKTGLELIA